MCEHAMNVSLFIHIFILLVFAFVLILFNFLMIGLTYKSVFLLSEMVFLLCSLFPKKYRLFVFLSVCVCVRTRIHMTYLWKSENTMWSSFFFSTVWLQESNSGHQVVSKCLSPLSSIFFSHAHLLACLFVSRIL